MDSWGKLISVHKHPLHHMQETEWLYNAFLKCQLLWNMSDNSQCLNIYSEVFFFRFSFSFSRELKFYKYQRQQIVSWIDIYSVSVRSGFALGKVSCHLVCNSGLCFPVTKCKKYLQCPRIYFQGGDLKWDTRVSTAEKDQVWWVPNLIKKDAF